MIIVYGCISHQGEAGKAAYQAISAARSGAKITLCGEMDDQGVSADISNIFDQEKIDVQNTVPEEIPQERTVVLLQTDIDAAANLSFLQQTKGKNVTVIMNLAPTVKMTQKMLDLLDYLILNQAEARQVAEQLGLNVEDNAIKIAQGLAQQGNLNCILTIGAQGAVAVTDDNKGWSVGALDVGEIVDRSGAEDAYCGTLAACIDAGFHLPRAMKRASVAGSLACTQQGIQNAFAKEEEIDARINDLDDPQAVQL